MYVPSLYSFWTLPLDAITHPDMHGIHLLLHSKCYHNIRTFWVFLLGLVESSTSCLKVSVKAGPHSLAVSLTVQFQD